MGREEILTVQDICKRYHDFFLDYVSFEIKAGEIVGLIGPNGAGKSTVLKLILGIIGLDEGAIFLRKEKMHSKDGKSLKERVGYVGENVDFFEKCRLKEIKQFYQLFYSTWDEKHYRSLMERFELLEGYKMSELSKGMKTKFSLCLALAHRPELLLMDEPTSGLDPLVRNEILALLKQYAKTEGAGILFSSHITEDMEKIAEELLFLYRGKLLDRCKMEDSTSTRQFLLSLPVSRADTIFEKNIMSYICIVAGILIANTGGWIIAIMKSRAFYPDLPLMLAICIFLIIYNTVYIFLNYRYDYSKTQFTPYILLGLMLVLFKFGDELMDFFDNNLFIIWLGALCVAIGLNWYILLKLGIDNRGMFDA